jgi:hypothetical protein
MPEPFRCEDVLGRTGVTLENRTIAKINSSYQVRQESPGGLGEGKETPVLRLSER